MSSAKLTNHLLLALKGTISIHYLDDTVLQGEYVSQDIFNIFVKVDGKPLMVPRSQIRYIEGGHIEQLEEDTSQAAFVKDELIQAEIPTPSSVEPPTSLMFEQAPIPAPPFEDEDEDSDGGTVILSSDMIGLFDNATEATEDGDDKTFVLPPTADMSDLIEEDDDNDLTFILSGSGELPEFDDEEDDGTVVLGPADIIEELDDTEKMGLVLEEEEEDATFIFTAEEPKRTASLVCTAGPHSGQVFKLDSDTISIGRSSDNHVVLSGDKEISRHHSMITREAGKFTIQDQSSLNGTFVNNEQVTQPRILQPDDMILVGISTLKYQEE
jgi:hypothetical protein